MCGFTVISTTSALQGFEEILRETTHRGPDDEAISFSNEIMWGFNRLAHFHRGIIIKMV